jgi:hypothetical protein
MPRFHIEPDGQYYAVYEGSELQFIAPTLFKAEIEMKLWQERVETAERLAAAETRLEANADEIAALKKHRDDLTDEIENLKRLKHPRQHGLDSVKHRREISPTPAWEAHVKERVIEKFKSDETALDEDIIDWIDRHWDSWVKVGWREGMVKKRKSEEWGRGHSTLAKLVSGLRETGELRPNPIRNLQK